MRILYIHNDYHQWSGEENASIEIANMLQEHGHEVLWLKRTTKGVDENVKKKVIAFFSGIYNSSIKNRLDEVLKVYQPDIVVVQNLYPFISSSIFGVLRANNVPVVMRCPNYRLFCPNGLCLTSKGEICERCWGRGHEWHCVVNNCESNFPKSVGYAIRNAYNRLTSNIINGVDCFIVQSEFQKKKFISQGIPESYIGILPGIQPNIGKISERVLGKTVTFVGRVSREKGIDEFIAVARELPQIPFRVLGKIDESYQIPAKLPSNVEFLGFRKGAELNDAYLDSRIIVVPSKWYEGFPNVILHAMLLKRPVITTNIGAMPSIIENNVNGILVKPADIESLKKSVSELYYDITKCQVLANNGFLKANEDYSRENIYRTLMMIFQQAINNHKNHI